MNRGIRGALVGLTMGVLVGGCAQSPPEPGALADRHVLDAPTYEWFNFNYHRISGCTRVGDDQIRVAVLFPNHERSQWELLAKTVVPACTTTIKQPARGEYYAYNPPAGQDLMVVWKNITTGDYGYMVIDPDTQAVYTNGPGVRLMPNDTSDFHSWRTHGHTVTMQAYNPNGTTNWLTNQRGVLFWFGVFAD